MREASHVKQPPHSVAASYPKVKLRLVINICAQQIGGVFSRTRGTMICSLCSAHKGVGDAIRARSGWWKCPSSPPKHVPNCGSHMEVKRPLPPSPPPTPPKWIGAKKSIKIRSHLLVGLLSGGGGYACCFFNNEGFVDIYLELSCVDCKCKRSLQINCALPCLGDTLVNGCFFPMHNSISLATTHE